MRPNHMRGESGDATELGDAALPVPETCTCNPKRVDMCGTARAAPRVDPTCLQRAQSPLAPAARWKLTPKPRALTVRTETARLAARNLQTAPRLTHT
eukprot:9477007-Pyramimonas_sp.AAC.2